MKFLLLLHAKYGYMCIWQLLLNLKIQTELIRVNVLTLLWWSLFVTSFSI